MKQKSTFKVILLVVIFFTLQNPNVFAQCLAPWCTNGNTLSGFEILGSTSGNYPLDIHNGAAYPIASRLV